MITINNYFESIQSIDFTNLPDAMKNGDKLARGAAKNNWSAYNSNDNIKRVVDAYINKLKEWVDNHNSTGQEETKKKVDPGAEKKQKQVNGDKKNQPKQPAKPEPGNEPVPTPVEKVMLEIAFIKRYVGLHGKTKYQKLILRFINSLQRAIIEKRIRKTSAYSKEIAHIQEQLIQCSEKMGESVDNKSMKRPYEPGRCNN